MFGFHLREISSLYIGFSSEANKLLRATHWYNFWWIFVVVTRREKGKKNIGGKDEKKILKIKVVVI